MDKEFPNLVLTPPLFYHWPIGIRFELGVNWNREYSEAYNPYIWGCYKRAIALFKAVHARTDTILVVMDVHDFYKGKYLQRQLNNFPSFVEKPLLFKLKHFDLPYIIPEDNEDGSYKTHRFMLECRRDKLHYKSIIKALCNADVGLRPSLWHSVYFINTTKKTIFHVYDDRGCDLIATSPETIRGVYEHFNEWILDYDRQEIEKVFRKSDPHVKRNQRLKVFYVRN
ncbi:DUF3885 domain-containing protein [Sutcliffiella cohnii]|uniref:DUF3885 domain-containing protein n=1 Tax=Sutcliffiella cohnii TaxID=33932 RepID=UPI002E2473C9|nr:DUF3885 domain-containing protein [Sutcliffiella cohnii]